MGGVLVAYSALGAAGAPPTPPAAAGAAAPASAAPASAAPAAAARPDGTPILLAVREAGLPLGAEFVVIPDEGTLPEPPGPSTAAFNGRYYAAARRLPPGLHPKLDALRHQGLAVYDDKGVPCAATIGEISIVRFGQAWGSMPQRLSDPAQLPGLAEKMWSTPAGPGGRDNLQLWQTAAAVKLAGDPAACPGALIAVPASKKLAPVPLRSAKALQSAAFQQLDSSSFGEGISAKVQLERLSSGLSPISARMLTGATGPSLLLLYVSVLGKRSVAFYALPRPDSMSEAEYLGLTGASTPSRVLGADLDGDGAVDAVLGHGGGVTVVRQAGPAWAFDRLDTASPLRRLDH